MPEVKRVASPRVASPVQQPQQPGSGSGQTRNGKSGNPVISLGSLVNQKLVNGYQKNLDELKKSHNQVAYGNNEKATLSSFDFSLNEASRAPAAQLPYSIHAQNINQTVSTNQQTFLTNQNNSMKTPRNEEYMRYYGLN